jgi:hypothetical protein
VPRATAERRAVILVEGVSDRAAVQTLAARQGWALADLGVEVLPMGGATNVRDHVGRLGPHGLGLPLAGLYDAPEEAAFLRGCAAGGLGEPGSRADLERLGFFACERDLEDELIRALGVERAVRVVADEGDGDRWRTFCRQPAQRDRPAVDRLRRFFGTASGRKERYARALVEALDLAETPQPLGAVLRRVGAAAS